jgi:hypothetical protein
MSDISLPVPVLPAQSLWRIARITMLLAFAFAGASIRIEECRTVPGAFSNGFPAGFDVSRKVCGQAALATVVARKVAGALQTAIR